MMRTPQESSRLLEFKNVVSRNTCNVMRFFDGQVSPIPGDTTSSTSGRQRNRNDAIMLRSFSSIRKSSSELQDKKASPLPVMNVRIAPTRIDRNGLEIRLAPWPFAATKRRPSSLVHDSFHLNIQEICTHTIQHRNVYYNSLKKEHLHWGARSGSTNNDDVNQHAIWRGEISQCLYISFEQRFRERHSSWKMAVTR